MDDELKDRLLASLGLKRRNQAIDEGVFKRYTRSSYPGSPEQERDEVHRMHEIVLLHKLSGIRVGCLVEEDYFGEKVEYVVMSNFHIQTVDSRTLVVTGVDPTRREVVTEFGRIPFGEISRSL